MKFYFVSIIRFFLGWCFLFLCSGISSVFCGAYMLPVSYQNDIVVQSLVSWSEDEWDLNPCYGWLSCFLGPDVKYPQHHPGLYGSCVESKNCIRIERYRTASEVLRAWRESKGVPWKAAPYKVLNSRGACVGLFYIASPGIHRTDSMLWPKSHCGAIPPQNANCKISPDNLILDFGVMNARSLNGERTSSNLYITCNLKISLKIYAKEVISGNEKILFNKDNNFYSIIDFDWLDSFSGVRYNIMPRVPTTVNVGATLYSLNTPGAGRYFGTAIMFISYN